MTGKIKVHHIPEISQNGTGGAEPIEGSGSHVPCQCCILGELGIPDRAADVEVQYYLHDAAMT
jgi:hypothetical protein